MILFISQQYVLTLLAVRMARYCESLWVEVTGGNEDAGITAGRA